MGLRFWHRHIWKEYDRWFGDRIHYASSLLGRKELGRTPVTLVYYKCESCPARKKEVIEGREMPD